VRILILSHRYTVHVRRWHEGLRGRGLHVRVLVRAGEGAREVYAPPAWAGRCAPLRKGWQALAFLWLLLTFRPRVLHQHWFEVPRLARLFPRRLPLVISVWGADIIRDWSTAERAAARRYAGRAAAVLGTSRFLADAAADVLARPVERLYWGVDVRRFSPRPAEPHADFRVGFFKHLLPKYAPDLVVEAFATVHTEIPTASLHLYGDGERRDALARQAAAHGLADAVYFHGKIPYEAVPAAMAQCDIIVMPSRDASETLGIAALEAQAMGVPVIATEIGGIPEAVQDGVGGLLIPPGDAEALAAALLRLARDSALRARLGRQGRAFIAAHFDWERTLDAMEAVYRRVVGGT